MTRLAGWVVAVQIGLVAGFGAGVSLAQDAVATEVTPFSAEEISRTQAIVMNIAPDKARREISVVVREGLKSMRNLPPELRIARKAMHDGQEVSEADLRALADLWDGNAAGRVMRILVDRGDAALPADLAWYGTIALGTGRIWPLPRTIEALHRLDPETVPDERRAVFAEVLYAHAWAGNSLALDAVVDLNGEGKLFGPMSNETRARVLEQGDRIGDGRIALRMALTLLQQSPDGVPDATLLQEYLDHAISGNNLVVKTTALNLSAHWKEKRLEQATTQ